MKLNNEQCLEILNQAQKITLAELDTTYEMIGSMSFPFKLIFLYEKEGGIYYRYVN